MGWVSGNRFTRGLLQDVYLLSQDPLEDFAQIFQQMPAVEHLLRLRCSFSGSVEIVHSAISTDDLDPWMSQKPVS